MGRILQEHRAYPGPQVDPGRPQRGGDIRRACESLQVKKGSTIQNIKKLAQRWGLTQGSGKGNPRDSRKWSHTASSSEPASL